MMTDSNQLELPLVHEQMTQDEVAKLLRVTKGTLREWRRLKKGPAYIRASKAVFYMRADIKAWLERQKVSHDQVPA
jgi:predicted transcriptional regulator